MKAKEEHKKLLNRMYLIYCMNQAKIQYMKYMYYEMNETIMGDQEYDKLEKDTIRLHENYPDFNKESRMPSDNVGFSYMKMGWRAI